MLDLGLIGFVQPWILAAAVALPALWLLLRLTPPAPRRVPFPGLFLLRLDAPEETPVRTPLWLLLLRVLIASLLILALAGPLLNPTPRLSGGGPVLLVVDDGWAAAPGWERRQRMLTDLLSQAGREGREIALLRTAPPAQGGGVALERLDAASALEQVAGWEPKPWPVSRAEAAEVLEKSGLAEASVFWLSDGIAADAAGAAEADRLAGLLERLGPVRLFADEAAEKPTLLLPPESTAGPLELRVLRADGAGPRPVDVRAVGPGGEILARSRLQFEDGSAEAKGSLELPQELRNRIGRLEVTPAASAGSVVLFDERWRRRTVGLYGTHHGAASQPLLGDLYFIQRALAPFAEIREGSVEEVLSGPLSLVVMGDVGRLGDGERQQLEAWMDKGGVVLRFAGPRLAAGGDDFVPVKLRLGDRQLGGAMSWSEPLALAPFDPTGPFGGLAVTPEATVNRQVLAEPGPDLSRAVLASLSDGTPLITGRRVGNGWLILVHTTANTAWSQLPLSGLFVDILKRVLALSPGVGGRIDGLLELDAALDAFGRLGEPQSGHTPIEGGRLAGARPGPETPPGLYGPSDVSPEERDEVARVALNLQNAVHSLVPLNFTALAASPEPYRRAAEIDLAPWLLLAATLLILVDLLVAYAFRGLLPALRNTAAAVALLALLPAGARADDALIRDLTADTRLAYVTTGRPEIDEISHAGLVGLGAILMQRTSIDTGEPVAVDPAVDDLALFPLLYWPVPPDHPDLAPEALDHLRTYLRTGGMILFDTRDAGVLLPGQSGGGPGEQRLAQILAGIDLPPLVPMPEDHVLTRSFYLLQDFPGRFAGQPVWVEQASNGINDGVAGVIIGANDWAGAWAVDDRGASMLPVDPGGEEQREMARRFGVNVAMYALTGNYKTDQVHVPALLERLGQ